MTIEEKEQLLKIDRSTVIHYESEELARKVCDIFKKLGLVWCSGASYDKTNWRNGRGNMCYRPHYGEYGSVDYYTNNKLNIITAQEFINLHSMPAVNKKVYYRGDPERGSEIIEALTKLGGENAIHYNGDNDSLIYYIAMDNTIHYCNHCEKSLMWLLHQAGFTEAFLSEKPEIIEINGKKYEATSELKEIIGMLKEVE